MGRKSGDGDRLSTEGSSSYNARETIPESAGSTDPLAHVGSLIRRRRQELGLTLARAAELAGCAKSYLSELENGRRENPPGEALLRRLEGALGLRGGELVEAAAWQATPRAVKEEVERLKAAEQAATAIANALRGKGAGGGAGAGKGAGPGGSRSLDAMLRSGELKRLVERASGLAQDVSAVTGVFAARSAIPLINSVVAGYPREFTDLGYPARVADEYVRVPDVGDPDAFAARVVGDSMMPEYREGDVIVFSPAREVKAGMDCFARLEPDHETTFKRVYFERGTGGEELIRLQPLNPAYAARVVERERVAGLYAAVSVTRSL